MTRHNGRPGAGGWILLIYFLSGVCSLIDEVVWVRLLKLTLGNTVYATTIVVSVFLGGLALGALIMARYADRVKRRLRLYALLETAVTITALAVPWALKFVDLGYGWFFRTMAPSPGVLLVVQVLASAAVVLVPSMLMGSTLPLLGRHVAALESDAGRRVGRLYALNTLGAATGCALAGFVLIRIFGVLGTLGIAAGLNLIVAAAGWLLSRGETAESEPTQPEALQPSAPPAATLPSDEVRSRSFVLLAAAFFISGFVSVGYQIAWVRSVLFLLGGDTYVFASVLTIYLLGNVIGAGIGSRLAPRLARPQATFGWTLGVLAIAGVVYMPLLVLWASSLMAPFEALLEKIEPWFLVPQVMLAPLAQGTFLFLVPAVVMGIGFPIALQAWAAHVHHVGRSTGAAYSANTIGAVVGGAVTGFALIPLFGVQIAITLLGLLAAWTSAALVFDAARGRGVARRWAGAALAGALTLTAIALPRNLLTAVLEQSPLIVDSLETISVREGITATVTVHRDRFDGSLHLYTSGQSIAGDAFALRGDQKALGHFGVLLNHGARSVLSVGFGSGETTRCLALHDLERIDCVEIAPEVVRSSLEHFTHLNLGERLHDEVNMIYMDAKNYLHLTDATYDAIVNDSIHPKDFSENASLYSQEYFEAARERLRPGGLFVSWLPTYHLAPPLFDSIIGTLLDVFPHVTLWYITPNPAPLVLLVASSDAQSYSPDHIDRALQNPAIRESLAVIRVDDAMDLLNCYIGDETDLRRVVKTYRRNSDYTPYVEFATMPWATTTEMFQRFVLDVRSDSVFEHLDLSGLPAERRESWLAEFRARKQTGDVLLRSFGSDNELEQLKLLTDQLELDPGDDVIPFMRIRVEAVLIKKGQRVLQNAGPNRAMEFSDVILRIRPDSPAGWIVRSQARLAAGDPLAALEFAQRAVEAEPTNPEAKQNLREIASAAGVP